MRKIVSFQSDVKYEYVGQMRQDYSKMHSRPRKMEDHEAKDKNKDKMEKRLKITLKKHEWNKGTSKTITHQGLAISWILYARNDNPLEGYC
ncbi:hypothetical protein Tco_1450064 [Tanacetum coccineum]